jgi:hypothetical protein
MSTAQPSPASPKRRWFLKTTLAVVAVGAAVGGGIWVRRGFDGSALTPHGREVFKAVARGVLGPLLPAAGTPEREAMLTRYLGNLEALINSLPKAKRDQISLLSGLLANAPTRWMLSGMWTSWADASDEQVIQALRELQSSDALVPNISYAAARALTCMAYFTIPDYWSHVGYPGPMAI